YSSYRSSIWSPLPALDFRAHGITRVEESQHDPVSLIAEIATRQAVLGAGLRPELADKRANTYRLPGIDPQRAGVYMGTGIGGAKSFLENFTYQAISRPRLALEKARDALESAGGDAVGLHEIIQRMVHGKRFNPFVVSMLMPNAVSAYVGVKYALNGPNLTSTVACAAGTVALGQAFRALRAGEIDVAIAGGAEYLDDYYGSIFLGFDVAGALVRDFEDADAANRPFDVRRSGFLFSQGGACVLVLEALDHAEERGAPIVAELAGAADTFDAYSMMNVAPDGRQVERMIRGALADADLEPADIQYVNAHGTGTQANDEIEAMLIERVFGTRVRVNSTKSLLGHTIGASGALEAAVTALSLEHQCLHPCRNLEQPVAELAFVRETTHADLDAALSHSFAFGGHNAGLVFRRYTGR
ncbi:MAG: beta-ketoacyl-[acyl-carrier-protein] synthase family protein, partial [Gammaproteobacteria bacterium]|nr:beta-ketoacyl-[acyl-carrier-protein] synthase family protein [Gammaproteobacteria bacterium]